MDVATLATLAPHIEDVVATDGGTLASVSITELADGSHRTVAFVEMQDGDHEQTYRVITPAPWNSPAWASHYTDFIIEVRVGAMEWMELQAA